MTLNEKKLRFIFELRNAGITKSDVLTVMETIPRSHFLSKVFKGRSFDDVALPIGCGQTISQPAVVGLMTQSLDLNKKCKVLEVGTGSGYQAAILSKLSRRVYTIERYFSLASEAENRLQNLEISNVTVIKGDGSLGLSAQAPFDRIIVTAASEDMPQILLTQLKPNGIMVIPVGQSDTIQKLIKVQRIGENYHYSELNQVRFVPLVDGIVSAE